MKQKTMLCVMGALAALLSTSCEEFIETDLSKKQMTIIAPADNTVAAIFNQTFWWEELKGAESYQLQIVKPGFDAVQQFITDTTVYGPRLMLTLQPGTYQWRIRAKNGSSATAYVTRTLVVDSTLDLSGQPMTQSLPADNYYSKQMSNHLSWQIMPNSDSYVLQIRKSGGLIETVSFTDTSTTYTFPNEGTYEWRVFAQNSTSNSTSSSRTIVIDTTRPPVPSPLFPVTDTSSAEPIVLGWSDTESNLIFRLMISTDSTFSTFRDTLMSATTYNLFGAVSGQYNYWKVNAIDRALNESAYITRRRIKKN